MELGGHYALLEKYPKKSKSVVSFMPLSELSIRSQQSLQNSHKSLKSLS